jgi:dihydropteroate synthase|tara:strand:- start:72 stop:464 length:393 start_codon:yes stop_codon:yes gene_type:complete
MSIDSTDESIQGKFFKINKKIKKKIIARYHKIKDFVIDPKGYFLISIDKKEKLIRVGYCTFEKLEKNSEHSLQVEIVGKTSIEITNTLIREKYISSLQHAGDMGIELHKAEIALKNNLNYIQDKDLVIKS